MIIYDNQKLKTSRSTIMHLIKQTRWCTSRGVPSSRLKAATALWPPESKRLWSLRGFSDVRINNVNKRRRQTLKSPGRKGRILNGGAKYIYCIASCIGANDLRRACSLSQVINLMLARDRATHKHKSKMCCVRKINKSPFKRP
jgi:hypothetical protein